jgi:formate hydrogenlyase subunit 6/NADH:ubiquinone oxidoreductase subunit I
MEPYHHADSHGMMHIDHPVQDSRLTASYPQVSVQEERGKEQYGYHHTGDDCVGCGGCHDSYAYFLKAFLFSLHKKICD